MKRIMQTLAGAVGFLVGLSYVIVSRRYRSSAYAALSPTGRFSTDQSSMHAIIIGYLIIRYIEYRLYEKRVIHWSPIDGFSDYATFRL